MEFYDITYIYVFEVGEFNGDTCSEFHHHRVTLKIQYKPEVLELRGYPSFSLVEFYDITYIYVLEGSENSMVTVSEFYYHRLTSKIQYKPEVLELRGYPSFSLVEFYDIT